MPAAGPHVDWTRFKPTDRATLVFVICAGQILLIRKKRGLGAGKINGPGGRLEPGESPLEGAIREVREELGVTPTGLRDVGRQRFLFTDGYGIDVTVFRADGCRGEPRETDEAVPLWTPVGAIPYHEMWEDDALWLPHVIAGRRVHGRYVFEGDRMLSSEIEILGPPDS